MKLSTRGRYGLRAMIELAKRHGSGPVLTNTISETQGISTKYLHALLNTLRAAGLVRSIRGAKGGFVLAREPSDIDIKEIVVALEGSLGIVDCVQTPDLCGKNKDCPARRLWEEVGNAISAVLTKYTLEDLARPDACAGKPAR
ncbi:MAG: Rrf2 family transcriptional regulator [Deltaproteobacteria bacterium]|nr:Rrf2 family transcriptional regulator [Deltaproteobacteria bacterium]